MTEPSLEIKPQPAPAAETAPDTRAPLEPAQAVGSVAQSEAVEMVKLDAEDERQLDEMVSAYLDAVTSLDTGGPAFASRIKDINNLGSDDIRSSAAVSNRLLEKPVSTVKGGAGGTSVSRSLLELRKTVERLDPKRQGNLLSPRKVFGVIPVGDPLVDYFRKYQSSQTHINKVIVSLYDGQEELRRDNADLEKEKQNLVTAMHRLRQYAYLAEELDRGLTRKIAEIEPTDPERAKLLKEDLLFPVRQKRQDLLTQLAVSVQGYLALDLIRRNNLELIKGVDRATTTTVSALRTAVIVAQALADQKLVLDQISALNETTGTLIESTSEMLKDQSAAVGRQAYETTVGIDRLEKAFANIYATMDEIDTFKVRALDSMQQTISALDAQVEKSREYMNRARAAQAAHAELNVGTAEEPVAPAKGRAS